MHRGETVEQALPPTNPQRRDTTTTTATTIPPSTTTQPQDNAAFPRTPEAFHQAGGTPQLPVMLGYPATGITAHIPPQAPGAQTVVVELRLVVGQPSPFAATFVTLPSAINYMLADPPPGRVRISDFREAVDFLNWVRADIADATPAEFLRMDVRGRVTKAVAEVAAVAAVAAVARLRPGVPAHFAQDLRGAEACAARAMESGNAGRRCARQAPNATDRAIAMSCA